MFGLKRLTQSMAPVARRQFRSAPVARSMSTFYLKSHEYIQVRGCCVAPSDGCWFRTMIMGLSNQNQVANHCCIPLPFLCPVHVCVLALCCNRLRVTSARLALLTLLKMRWATLCTLKCHVAVAHGAARSRSWVKTGRASRPFLNFFRKISHRTRAVSI